MTNFYASPVHKKAKLDALERYKRKPLIHLRAIRGVYESVRKDSIRLGDSRWKTPQSDDKLCVKEHLKLVNMAIDSKKPITIRCNPAILGSIDAKKA